MKIIEMLELDENAEILNKKELEKIKELPSVIHSKKEEKGFEYSGQWLVLDELLEIDNQYLFFLHDEENEMTWIKLPELYVEENYLVNYAPEDQCPLGIDVLIKEDNYPIGVVTGCDSIKQAKVNNNLDGHKYKGELGITLNKDLFLSFNDESEEFEVVKTKIDWDRGERTV